MSDSQESILRAWLLLVIEAHGLPETLRVLTCFSEIETEPIARAAYAGPGPPKTAGWLR